MAEKAIHEQLMDGLTVKSRDAGDVHTIKGADGKTTVAEVCVGKSGVTRLNFNAPIPSKAPKHEALDLKVGSASWKGGGCRITAENLAEAKALLQFVVDQAQPAPEAEPTAGDAAEGGATQEKVSSRVRGGKNRTRQAATA